MSSEDREEVGKEEVKVEWTAEDFDVAVDDISRVITDFKRKFERGEMHAGNTNMEELQNVLVKMHNDFEDEIAVLVADEGGGRAKEVKDSIRDFFHDLQLNTVQNISGKWSKDSAKKVPQVLNMLDSRTKVSVYEVLCKCLKGMKDLISRACNAVSSTASAGKERFFGPKTEGDKEKVDAEKKAEKDGGAPTLGGDGGDEGK